jgi:hypothetical protein
VICYNLCAHKLVSCMHDPFLFPSTTKQCK